MLQVFSTCLNTNALKIDKIQATVLLPFLSFLFQSMSTLIRDLGLQPYEKVWRDMQHFTQER
ncbi:MAG: hypothetical protein ABL933_10920, partial [Methyloglobulus sp.]